MSVASKNLYDLLGNDIEDPDAVPKAPSKIVEKASTHTVKRNAEGVAPDASVNRRGGVVGNDAGFRDRQSGNSSNNTRARAEGDAAPRGGRGARLRGGRGARRPPNSDDRHSRSVPSGGSDKQAALSWGATEGEAELKDEQAAEAIAQADQKDAAAEGGAATPADEVEAEPEDKTISYADYLAQQAEKKLALEQENALKVRKANEGTKADKKWATAKELVKGEEEEVLFAGSGGKAKRERERKQKQFVEIENRFVEQPERTRGGARGGRGGNRGESSGRGRGEGRGRGGPRGGPRGDFRGDSRGGRGRGGAEGAAAKLNPKDESAFPSLGS